MRLLQLATGPDEVLDLHPNVTVVTGLDDDGHDLLVDAVTRLARAEAAEGPGLLEAHGVLFDLDPALLEVIGSTERDLDPIVRPGQLPPQVVSVDARELRSREEAFASLLELIATQAERQSAARGAVAAAAAAVDHARAVRSDAEAGGPGRGLDRLAQRLEALADERRRIRQELHRVDPLLDAARAARVEAEVQAGPVRQAEEAAIALRVSIEADLTALDAIKGDAPAEVERARAALQRLERAHGAGRDRVAAAPARADAAPEASAVRLRRIDARIQELEHLLVVVTPVERLAIEEARGLLIGGESVDLVPSAEAAHLADELDRISAELGDPRAEHVTAVGDASLADARARLGDARQALLEAEEAVRSPELDSDDLARLEDIHTTLVNVTEKATGRFSGGRRGANQAVQLRAAEQELLDRLGFASYSAYMMGYSRSKDDPTKEAEVDRARQELAAAEAAWRTLAREAEAGMERAAVLDRRRELLEQARRMLGRNAPGGGLQAALRALRVPAVSRIESARVLQASLEAAGVDLGGEDLDHEELLLIADAWLTEADQVDGRRHAALEQLAALQVERADLLAEGPVEEATGAAAAPQVAAVRADTDAEVQQLEQLAEARARLTAAELRLSGSGADREQRAALVADLATAWDMERAATAARRAADAETSSALAKETQHADHLDQLERELAAAGREVAEAEDALSKLSDAESDPAMVHGELEAAEALHAEAVAEMELVDRTLASLDAEGRAAALEIEHLQDVVSTKGAGTSTPAEELEWYLLARLASQRSVSVAGSVPLLVDHALRGLDIAEVGHLLGRLERMAEAVQVIVISDDPVVASWAVAAGPARAAVVSPTAC